MTQIYTLIKEITGLNLSDAHKNFVRVFVERRKKELSASHEEYLALIASDKTEQTRLIDEAAINETYLFREEQQFDFLKDTFFPGLKDKNFSFWSAACSTGEESISIYTLACSLGYNPTVHASDIDTRAIEKFKKGQYGINSFRTDGSKYFNILSSYGTLGNKTFTINPELLSSFNIFQCNLISEDQYPFSPESLDLIFVRNVFIYFESATRESIIRKMAKCLKPGGIIFLSVNEIASVDVPKDSGLIKEHLGRVYFFRKTGGTPEKTKGIFQGSSETQKKSFFNQESFISRPTTKDPKKSALPSPEAENKFSERIQNLEKECSKVLAKINAGHEKEARQILDSITFRPENAEYKWYFEGMLANSSGDTKTATECYNRSALYNRQFWPSTFQLGLLHFKNNNPKESKKAFTDCANALHSYINSKKVCYNFIVESFNPSYFLKLCENYLEKLTD